KPNQKVAFAAIHISNNVDLNQAIQHGLIIEGKQVTLSKAQPNPSQCYNCHTYSKPFHFVKDCPQVEKCGTCGKTKPNHTTQNCLVTTTEDQYCTSCHTKG
ncbi:hypothetical protein J3R82DRAFT_9889, partial [Butyriboletus roseoflavus]